MFKGRSKALFVASLLTTMYVIYLMVHFGSSIFVEDSAEALGGALATALVAPHMFILGLGVIFGWVGFFAKKAWAALVAAILYCVGGLLFFVYFMFVIPSIILGFIGYSKQKKLNNSSNNVNA